MISKLSEKVLSSRRFLLLLIAINLVGFIFGIYYYMPQLAVTPSYLWLLVIDCPLYVFLFALVLVCLLVRFRLQDVLIFAIFVGLIKYGLWTVLVILLHSSLFFSVDAAMYCFLLVSHVGMMAESVVLWGSFRPTVYNTAAVALFFLANDISDYVYGTLPTIPQTWVPALFVESLLVSVLIPLLAYRLRRLT
jgi:uncharacterized membrane protein YpjA